MHIPLVLHNIKDHNFQVISNKWVQDMYTLIHLKVEQAKNGISLKQNL